MILFPKALFLATTFPKMDKNSIFLLNFYQMLSKISQNFPAIVCRPKARKINAWFVNFYEKYARIMDFSQLRNFWKHFKNFSKFPNNVFLVQTREKLTHGLLNFLKNMQKSFIFCSFLKKLFENFRKLSGVRPGAPPLGPPTRPTPKVFPPNRNPGGAAGGNVEYPGSEKL